MVTHPPAAHGELNSSISLLQLGTLRSLVSVAPPSNMSINPASEGAPEEAQPAPQRTAPGCADCPHSTHISSSLSGGFSTPIFQFPGPENLKKSHRNLVVVTILQSLSCIQLSVTSWTAGCQAPLSSSISWSLLKFMTTESVIPSKHLILCRPLLLLPSIFPSFRVFFNESALCIKSGPKYWSFSNSPSNEYSGLVSFRIDWFE